MARLLVAVTALLCVASCESSEPVRTRLADLDALCTDRAKPVAYNYAVPDEAYRAGCFDLRVHQRATDPRTGREERWQDLVYCCPR